MAIIKKTKNNMYCKGCRKGKPWSTVGGTVIGGVTMENNMEVPQKIKNRTIMQSSNSTSGY